MTGVERRGRGTRDAMRGPVRPGMFQRLATLSTQLVVVVELGVGSVRWEIDCVDLGKVV